MLSNSSPSSHDLGHHRHVRHRLRVVCVRAIACYRLVKVALKNVPAEHRAEVLRAVAILLEERHWWQRKNRDLRALLEAITSAANAKRDTKPPIETKGRKKHQPARSSK